MIVTLILANKDEQDLASGHKRKKAGDIIAVCPENHIGGDLTRKTHLLVRVDLGNEIKTLLQAQVLASIDYGEADVYSPLDNANSTPVRKRRFNIPLTELVQKASLLGKTLDIENITDDKLDYQPLTDSVLSYNDLIKDKTLNRKIDNTDLTTISGVKK